jgi:hypothetical protein
MLIRGNYNSKNIYYGDVRALISHWNRWVGSESCIQLCILYVTWVHICISYSTLSRYLSWIYKKFSSNSLNISFLWVKKSTRMISNVEAKKRIHKKAIIAIEHKVHKKIIDVCFCGFSMSKLQKEAMNEWSSEEIQNHRFELQQTHIITKFFFRSLDISKENIRNVRQIKLKPIIRNLLKNSLSFTLNCLHLMEIMLDWLVMLSVH